MPKPMYHYVPTAGVRADFKRLMNEFISAQTVRYEQFSEMWRKRRFSYLCAGRSSDRETREFLERVLLIATEFFLPPYQFQVRVGGLYLLYGIFMTQPIAPKVKVRLTVSQWDDTIQFQQEATEQNHLDVVYVFNKMIEECAFQFCYTPSEMNERTLNPEREDDEINLADDMKVEQREIDRLFDYESMEQLSYLLKHYHQMKVGMAGRKATKPDKSLDVVQGSMVEGLVGMLQSFKESCSNIYKHGTANASTSNETAGPSNEYYAGQTVLEKRQAIKSRIFGETDVHSPIKKSAPAFLSPVAPHSYSKKSSVKFSIKGEEEEEEEDVLEALVSPTKMRQGRPRKIKSSLSPSKKVSKTKECGTQNGSPEVQCLPSPPRKRRQTSAATSPRSKKSSVLSMDTHEEEDFLETLVSSRKIRRGPGRPKKSKVLTSQPSQTVSKFQNSAIQVESDDDNISSTPSKKNSPTSAATSPRSKKSSVLSMDTYEEEDFLETLVSSRKIRRGPGRPKKSKVLTSQPSQTVSKFQNSAIQVESDDDNISSTPSKKNSPTSAVCKATSLNSKKSSMTFTDGNNDKDEDLMDTSISLPKVTRRPGRPKKAKCPVSKLTDSVIDIEPDDEYVRSPSKKNSRTSIDEGGHSILKRQPANRKRMALSKKLSDSFNSDGDDVMIVESDQTSSTRSNNADRCVENNNSNVNKKGDKPGDNEINSQGDKETDEPPKKKSKAGGKIVASKDVSLSKFSERNAEEANEIRSKTPESSNKLNDKHKTDESHSPKQKSTIHKRKLDPTIVLSDDEEDEYPASVEPVTRVPSSVPAHKQSNGVIALENSTCKNKLGSAETSGQAAPKRRGRPRKEVVLQVEDRELSQKGKGLVNKANDLQDSPGSSKRRDRVGFKQLSSGADAQKEKKNNSPSKLVSSEKQAVIKTVDTALGGKSSTSKTVNIAKTPLASILGGKAAVSSPPTKKPVKFIKIVAKSKAEAEELLKSIEKQKASGEKLLSNLPSGCVKTISVGTNLSTNKTVLQNITPGKVIKTAIGNTSSKYDKTSNVKTKKMDFVVSTGAGVAKDSVKVDAREGKKKEQVVFEVI